MTHIFAREGDFIKTIEGLIYDIKGLVHPANNVIAFLRYIPDPTGKRMVDGVRYRKLYALKKRYYYLLSNAPHYLYTDSVINDSIQAIPHEKIKQIYYPHEYLENLFHKKRNRLENSIIELINFLTQYSGVLQIDLGVTGSFMVGLNTPNSDFDLIVYGIKNSHRIYNTLDPLFDAPDIPIERYNNVDLKKLYDFRGKDSKIDFENFVHFEKRKKLQGKFKNIDFYIRCVKAWDEIKEKYGYFRYKPLGQALIQGIITNDDESIFTPCRYKIEDVKILHGTQVEDIQEVFSYRGRCCEAKKNESIIAQGKVELVIGEKGEQYCRLVVGGEESDFLYS